jgi:release factor glutamine methyltransferase
MTIRDARRKSGLGFLDAEVLLAAILRKDRSWIVSHDEVELTPEQEKAWHSLEERRKGGEPVAYIMGEKEFYGRLFTVTHATLIPRPSTEKLVEHTLAFLKNKKEVTEEVDTNISIVTRKLRDGSPAIIVDVETGSGIIPITLALEGRKEKMIGIDISHDAVDAAKKNALHYHVDVECVHGDGIEFIKKMSEPFFLVSNPPYIPDGTTLMKDVSDFEPHTALFAGSDGLSVIQPLLEAAKSNPHCVGFALELQTDQIESIEV